MAISKVQPMRSAEIQLVELANSLESGLAQEISARETADNTLQTNITAEVNARTAADSSLQASINSEISARTAADNTLQNNINAEASTRAAAVTALQGSITNEASAREVADNGLQEQINALPKLEVGTQPNIEVPAGTSQKITVSFTSEKTNVPTVVFTLGRTEENEIDVMANCNALLVETTTTSFSVRVDNTDTTNAQVLFLNWLAVEM